MHRLATIHERDKPTTNQGYTLCDEANRQRHDTLYPSIAECASH